MILSRRKAHFYAAIGLACTLPILFIVGLICRPPNPTVDESTDALFAAANFPIDTPDTEGNSETLSGKGIQLQTEVIFVNGDVFLDIQPTQAIQFADVLVYWHNSLPEGDPVISEDAILLGQLAGTSRRRFPLPTEIQGEAGHLILYSRGKETLVVTFPFTLAVN